MLDEPGGIDQAAQLAAAYRAILPWDYALDLLQAEISVMNGQLESADESLRRATRNNPPLLFRTEVACVQAQLALRRGNRPKAESLLAWARRYDDHCMLADRAARELRICQKITLSIDSVR